MPLALFDLDDTVFGANLGRRFLVHAFRVGLLERSRIPRAITLAALHRAHFVSRETLAANAASALRGLAEGDLREEIESFYRAQAHCLVRPGALLSIARHHRAGDACIAVTSWVTLLSQPLCADLGFSGFIGNEVEVDSGGKLTGVIRPPMCSGDGKVTRARAYAQAVGERLEDATAYGNSARGDLALLDSVRTPVAIAPDRTLKRIAHSRGWAIENWGHTP